MPHSPCQAEGCGAWATYRGRCAKHARVRERETHHHKQTYNRAKWRHTRERYLTDHPLCEDGCGRLAEDVHHKVGLSEGGDPWSMDNLEALSHSCHAARHARERAGNP